MEQQQVIGYLRVSTAEQASEGHSPDAQRAKIQAWADAHGMVVAQLYEDAGISGKRADNRPELQKALAHVCRVKGMLVFYSLSRLARSVIDAAVIAERLQAAGAGMASVVEPIDTTTAAGRMIYGVLSCVAQFEREVIVERINSSLGMMKRAGKRTGTVPYGWLADGDMLIECEPEQIVLRRIVEEKAGGKGLRLIARALNDDGIPAKAGGTWSPSAVASVLERQAKAVAL